jgi:hypothetical protein
MKIFFSLLIIFVSSFLNVSAQDYDGRHGWPIQKIPKKIIACTPGKNLAEAMLLESLSGLCAQAVNDGYFDEMVWINVKNENYKKIYDQTIQALKITEIREMNIWTLVDYLKKKKIIKGFILYKLDKPRINVYGAYPDFNYSSNVATVYASLLKGVLIDESLIQEVQTRGLKKLKDARSESLKECFEKNKSKLNNASALSVPPGVSNLRDYAIAQKLMLYADKKEFAEEVLQWVKPLSPVIGWGCGDEYDFTSVISSWGLYNTATNWCWNLPLISSVSDIVEVKKVNEIGLKEINFTDTSSFHAYVMSDGDNMQWTMGSFIDNSNYLGNKERNDIGLSWTLCPTNLSIISPFTWNAIAAIPQKNISYLEYGGGYQYPDLFAINRPNRTQLLREFAKRINFHLKKLGIKIFGFICIDVSGKAAQEAFQIYAEELEDITGMMAVQYFPYELGGEIYWKKNKKDIDIPIVTARYSIWNEVNKNRPRAGTPEFVASLINRDAITANLNRQHTLSWTIVHAWSDFTLTSKITEKPAIGFNPVKASEKLLINEVKAISANELLWRIRMHYRNDQTKSLLK